MATASFSTYVFFIVAAAAALLLVTSSVDGASISNGRQRHHQQRHAGSCVRSGLCCQQKNNSCRAYPYYENEVVGGGEDAGGEDWMKGLEKLEDEAEESEEREVDEKEEKSKNHADDGCFCDAACHQMGDCCHDYKEACKPVDCVLADEWEDWGECDVRCGPGVKQRRRRVVQVPLNGGQPCGTTVEKRPCHGTQCKFARSSNGLEELDEMAYIVPAVFGSYRTSKRLGYNPFIDIRRNIFEYYDGKNVIKRPAYCMEFELKSVSASCNDAALTDDVDDGATDLANQSAGSTAAGLVKGSTVCVECQTTAMHKKLGGRCRGQGVLNKVTRWKAVTMSGCRGRWVLKSRQEECQCSADSATSFVLV